MSALRVSRSETAPVPWWMVMLEGIALVILGILWLAFPKMTTVIVMQFLGLYFLSVGIFEIIGIFHDRSMWGWKLFSGIIGIIAGFLAIQHPLWSTVFVGITLVIVLGISGLLIGSVRIWTSFRGGSTGSAILGVLSVLFGIILLFNAREVMPLFTLPPVLGILSLVGGILAIVMAFRLK